VSRLVNYIFFVEKILEFSLPIHLNEREIAGSPGRDTKFCVSTPAMFDFFFLRLPFRATIPTFDICIKEINTTIVSHTVFEKSD
jgi:hypothetical protein